MFVKNFVGIKKKKKNRIFEKNIWIDKTTNQKYDEK